MDHACLPAILLILKIILPTEQLQINVAMKEYNMEAVKEFLLTILKL